MAQAPKPRKNPFFGAANSAKKQPSNMQKAIAKHSLRSKLFDMGVTTRKYKDPNPTWKTEDRSGGKHIEGPLFRGHMWKRKGI